MKRTNQGFTRVELFFCALGIALLLAPALSLLASNRSESQRIICFNNLSRIGQAYRVWASDHNDTNPMWVPVSEGGYYGAALVGNAWYQFTAISNQLGSPKFLVCPADFFTQSIATDWGAQPNGFLNAQNRANALSYAIYLHASPQDGKSILCSDRSFRASSINQICLSGVNACIGLAPTDLNIGWTNEVHKTSGHLLFNDGSVVFSSSEELRSAVSRFLSDSHVLKPR